MRKKHKIISLFSGAGGLDLGFKLSGKYDVLLANDVKSFMAETYSLNFGVKKYRKITPSNLPQIVLSDITKLDFSSLKDLDVDVIVGGPPCQDFSVLRASTAERGGIRVRRGRLYAHFVRALVTQQPAAFVFENVPGLVSSNDGLAYKTIVEDFSHLNLRWEEVKRGINVDNDSNKIQGYYLIFNEVVDATMFGVPQTRRRLIIVGVRKDLIRKMHPFEMTHTFRRVMMGRYKRLKKYPLTCMEAFEGRALPDLQDEYEENMKDYEEVWKTIKSAQARRRKREMWDKLTFDVIKDYLTVNKIPLQDRDELAEAFEEHKKILKELGYWGVRVSSLKLADGSNMPPREPPDVVERVKMIPPGENFKFLIGTRWELRRKGVSQIYRKLHPIKPSYTVVAYGGGGMAMYHYTRSRSALTNREKARLQTFPDSFRFVGSYSTMKAEIGEAVPPLLAKRIAEALSHILDLLG